MHNLFNDWNLESVAIILVSCISYSNVVNAPFLYDDLPAIVHNPDVKGRTGLLEVFNNDFWGDNMRSKNSHMSYRPVTVLLFRWIHWIWEDWTTPYHVINILLHSIASCLFYIFCRKVVFCSSKHLECLVAGLLFSLHPIHTEAVCGVVGCAEILSFICFISALLVYYGSSTTCRTESDILEKKNVFLNEDKISKNNSNGKTEEDYLEDAFLRQRKNAMAQTVDKTNQSMQNVSSINNMLHEEKSMSYSHLLIALVLATVGMFCKETGVTVLGIMIANQLIEMHISKNKSSSKMYFNVDAAKPAGLIVAWGLAALILRMTIMGWRQPKFEVWENPASFDEKWLTRSLTYIYLSWFNFRLLVLPFNLSYDYSFDTIPLVTSILDPRNLVSLSFLLLCIVCVLVLMNGIRKKTSWFRLFFLGLSMMVLPFIPASNLFFRVGFVVAERVLYLPSSGYIILLVWAGSMVNNHLLVKRCARIAVTLLLCFYFFQTYSRNDVWTSQEKLFRSGVEAYPHNPKAHYNWGVQLSEEENWAKAATEFETVMELYPSGFYIALINLGVAWEKLGKPLEILENVYKKCIKVEPTCGKCYYNLGAVYAKQNRQEKAIQVLKDAVIHAETELWKMAQKTQELAEQHQHAELKAIHFDLLKKICLQDVGRKVLERCSLIFVPSLQSYAQYFSQKGHFETFSKLNNIIHDVKKVEPEAMSKLLKALQVSKNVEETCTLLMI